MTSEMSCLSGGGTKGYYKTYTVTPSTSYPLTEAELGFKPKYVMVLINSSSGTVFNYTYGDVENNISRGVWRLNATYGSWDVAIGTTVAEGLYIINGELYYMTGSSGTSATGICDIMAVG